jgi:hypothetical protein
MRRNLPRVGIGLGLVVLLTRLGVAQTQATNAPDLKLAFQSDSPQYTPSAIRTQCIDFKTINRGNGEDDYSDCAVSESGEIGNVDGKTYIYAIYCLIPTRSSNDGKCGGRSFTAGYHRARGLAIFVRDSASDDMRLLTQRVDLDLGLYYYEKPEIIRTAAGDIFEIPIVVDGTGHFNESEYYLWENLEWRRLDSMSWLNELSRQIPLGLAMWKGVWPNLTTMEAIAGLYRRDDANCCPTGGEVRVKLAIRSGQFVIESVAVQAPEPDR